MTTNEEAETIHKIENMHRIIDQLIENLSFRKGFWTLHCANKGTLTGREPVFEALKITNGMFNEQNQEREMLLKALMELERELI